MKTLTQKFAKLSVIAMILGLAAGCASVTDATLPESAQPADIEQITNPELPGPTLLGGNDVEPIIERPEL